MDLKNTKITLKQQYEMVIKAYSIFMPIMAVSCLVLGIVFSLKFIQVFWVGLIFVAMGIMTLGLLFILRRYMKRKISEIEEYEKSEQDKKQND